MHIVLICQGGGNLTENSTHKPELNFPKACKCENEAVLMCDYFQAKTSFEFNSGNLSPRTSC